MEEVSITKLLVVAVMVIVVVFVLLLNRIFK